MSIYIRSVTFPFEPKITLRISQEFNSYQSTFNYFLLLSLRISIHLNILSAIFAFFPKRNLRISKGFKLMSNCFDFIFSFYPKRNLRTSKEFNSYQMLSKVNGPVTVYPQKGGLKVLISFTPEFPLHNSVPSKQFYI